MYNFSREACAENARRMVEDYRNTLREREDDRNSELSIDDLARSNSTHLRWDDKLKDQANRRLAAEFSGQHIREVAYRPFVKQYLYGDRLFSQRPALTAEMFLVDGSEKPGNLRAGGRIDQAVLGAGRRQDAGSSFPGIRSVPSAVSLRRTDRWGALR